MELILSAAGSGSTFGMRIRIQETNLMRIHADPDPKHWQRLSLLVHRQNVEVTNAEWTKRLTTKRQIGQNAECQNVE